MSVVAAFQFRYSFPPLLALGFSIKKDAMREGDGFDPITGVVTRQDSGIKRWARGFMSRSWYVNVWHVTYLGGALATARLGAYAAIVSIVDAFKIPQLNAFICQSPLNLAPPWKWDSKRKLEIVDGC